MIAILGDIHSNISALTAVFNFCQRIGVSKYLSVGDIIGYYSHPNECIDLLLDNNVIAVKGNHDAYIFEHDALGNIKSSAKTVIEWTRNILDSSKLNYLNKLPYTQKIKDKLSFRIVHASLNRPYQWEYIKTFYDAINIITLQDTPICFYGHTHIPVVFSMNSSVKAETFDKFKIEEGTKYLVNVGSVGQPRQGELVAHVVLFDIDHGVIELKKIKYDPGFTINNHKKLGLPKELLEFLT